MYMFTVEGRAKVVPFVLLALILLTNCTYPIYAFMVTANYFFPWS